MSKRAPEALAEFAETARKTTKDGKKPKKDLAADSHTKPKTGDSKKKQDTAAKVLAEGATGKKNGAREAVRKMPNRIVESR